MASGGGKQTSEQKTILPEYITKGGQENYEAARDWNKANPATAYTGQMAPGANENQSFAAKVARLRNGQGLDEQMMARGFATLGGNAEFSPIDYKPRFNAPGVASSYMSPYKQEVQRATLGEMDRRATMNQRQVNDQAGAARAFGGDRHGIMAAEQRRNDDTLANNYIATSNQAAYEAAQGQYNQDRATELGVDQFNRGLQENRAGRQLQAGGLLSNIGSAASGIASNDVNRLITTGRELYDVEANQNDAAYQEFLRMQNAPMERYSQMAGILSGTPMNTTQTGMQRKKGSVMNTVLAAGQMAASIYSDARLKENVEPTGETLAGLPLYGFNYRYDTGLDLPVGRQVGVMAQDVIGRYPDAVSVDKVGYMKVDYDRLNRSA